MNQDDILRCSQCSKDELQTLLTISELVARRLPPREMFAQILQVLEQGLHVSRGTIMLLLPDDSELVVEATHSRTNAVHSEATYLRGEGIIGTVVETGRAVLVPRISEEPRFKSRIHKRSARERQDGCFLCIPVIIDNEVVGTFSGDLPLSRQSCLEQVARIVTIAASMIANQLKSERIMRMERESLQNENIRLRSDMGENFRPDSIVGNSKAMRDVFAKVHLLARSNTSVLIRGASGTGKELIASAIHYASDRADAPLVKVNCAALNENLLESELFGHIKGAFSGAVADRVGRIEEAQGGTLFLDEIGEFSHATQVKLLRVIQERQFEPVGSNRTRDADIRLITATNRDLEEAVRDNTFREDLYYRINVFPITIPPLHQRKEDILPLANHFIDTFNARLGRQVRRITTEAINMLVAYHWPGNVRELENCIEYAVLLSADGVIYAHNLPPTLQVPLTSDESAAQSLMARVRILERDMITDALKRSGGNMSAAARELGITVRMIRYKIKNLHIDTGRLFGSTN